MIQRNLQKYVESLEERKKLLQLEQFTNKSLRNDGLRRTESKSNLIKLIFQITNWHK
jgi:hypothetical protein